MLIIFIYLFLWKLISLRKKNVKSFIFLSNPFQLVLKKNIKNIFFLVLNICIYIFVLFLIHFCKSKSVWEEQKKRLSKGTANNHLYVLDRCKYYKQIQIFSFINLVIYLRETFSFKQIIFNWKGTWIVLTILTCLFVNLKNNSTNI